MTDARRGRGSVRGDKEAQALLLAIVAFNMLPHAWSTPPWVLAFGASILAWKALHLLGRALPPSRFIANVVAAACGAAVLAEYGTILGQEPATALLILLGSTKALDARTHRDSMFVVFTSYFLLMTHLLASQTLASTAFMALDVFAITTLTYHLHSRDRRGSARSFRPVMKLLAYSGPLMAFLFFAFPRFSAGLFPQMAAPSGRVGFSENLEPGAISRLVDSDATAFRVTFQLAPGQKRPSIADMYWRGAVLEDSEGIRWKRDLASHPAPPPPPSAKDEIVYETILEPGYRKFLFALDAPRSISFDEPGRQAQLRASPGWVFSLARDADARVLYRGTAQLSDASGLMPERAHDQRNEVWLQVPETGAAKAKSLVEGLAKGAKGAVEISERVLMHFARGGFRYTKSPGLMRDGTLDEFLFERKQGFCEHYAGAYATLMRLAGVPARVVVGFQGGLPNEFGSYVLVRGLDAHAWAEIYRADVQKWERIDPTLSVAPMRRELGGDFNLADPAWLSDRLDQAELQKRLGWLALGARRISLAWDAATTAWTGFLLRYDFDYQVKLFKSLGVAAADRAVFFVWLAFGAALMAVALYAYLRWQARREDPLLKAWRALCARLDQAGLERGPTEGPFAFAERAARASDRIGAEAAARAARLALEFADLRYGPGEADEARKGRFVQDARRFRVGRVT